MAVHSRRGVQNPFASGKGGGRGITYSNPRAGAGLPTHHIHGSPRTAHGLGGGCCGLRNALLVIVVGCATLYSFSGPSQAPIVASSLSGIYTANTQQQQKQQQQKQRETTVGLRGGKTSSSSSNTQFKSSDAPPKMTRPKDSFPVLENKQDEEDEQDNVRTSDIDMERGDSRDRANSRTNNDPSEEDHGSRNNNLGGIDHAGDEGGRAVHGPEGGTATQDADMKVVHDGTDAVAIDQDGEASHGQNPQQHVLAEGATTATKLGLESDGDSQQQLAVETDMEDWKLKQQDLAEGAALAPIDAKGITAQNDGLQSSIIHVDAGAPVEKNSTTGEVKDDTDHVGDDNVQKGNVKSYNTEIGDINDGNNTVVAKNEMEEGEVSAETAANNTAVDGENRVESFGSTSQLMDDIGSGSTTAVDAEIESDAADPDNADIQPPQSNSKSILPTNAELADKNLLQVGSNATTAVTTDNGSNATDLQNSTGIDDMVGNATADSSAAEQQNLTDQNALVIIGAGNDTADGQNTTNQATEKTNEVDGKGAQGQSPKEQDNAAVKNKNKEEPWKEPEAAVQIQPLRNSKIGGAEKPIDDAMESGEVDKTVDAKGGTGNSVTGIKHDQKDEKENKDEKDTKQPDDAPDGKNGGKDDGTRIIDDNKQQPRTEEGKEKKEDAVMAEEDTKNKKHRKKKGDEKDAGKAIDEAKAGNDDKKTTKENKEEGKPGDDANAVGDNKEGDKKEDLDDAKPAADKDQGKDDKKKRKRKMNKKKDEVVVEFR